jgi:Na+/melibiose symporter-like transporter
MLSQSHSLSMSERDIAIAYTKRGSRERFTRFDPEENKPKGQTLVTLNYHPLFNFLFTYLFSINISLLFHPFFPLFNVFVITRTGVYRSSILLIYKSRKIEILTVVQPLATSRFYSPDLHCVVQTWTCTNYKWLLFSPMFVFSMYGNSQSRKCTIFTPLRKYR